MRTKEVSVSAERMNHAADDFYAAALLQDAEVFRFVFKQQVDKRIGRRVV
jgi:hypothetical protein